MEDGSRHHGVSGKWHWFLLGFLLLACSELLTAQGIDSSSSDSSPSVSDLNTESPSIISPSCPSCSSSSSSSRSSESSSPSESHSSPSESYSSPSESHSSPFESDSSPSESDSSPSESHSSPSESHSSPSESDSSPSNSDSSPSSNADSSSSSYSDSSSSSNSDSSPSSHSDSSSSSNSDSSSSSPSDSSPSSNSDSSPSNSDYSPSSNSDSSSSSNSDSSPSSNSDSSPSSNLDSSPSSNSDSSSSSNLDSSPSSNLDSSPSSNSDSSPSNSDSSPSNSDSSPSSNSDSSPSSNSDSSPSSNSDSSPSSNSDSSSSSNLDSSSSSNSDSSPSSNSDSSSSSPSDSSSSSNSDSSPSFNSDSSPSSNSDSSSSSNLDSSSSINSDSSPSSNLESLSSINSDSSPSSNSDSSSSSNSESSSSSNSDSSPSSNSDSSPSFNSDSSPSSNSDSSSTSTSDSSWSSDSDFQSTLYDYACSWASYIVAVTPEAIAGAGGKNSLIGPPDAYPCYTAAPTTVPSFSYIIFDIPEPLFIRRIVIYMVRGIAALEYIMVFDHDEDEFLIMWEVDDPLVTECSAGIFSAEMDFHEFPTDSIALTFDGSWSDEGIEVDAIQVYGTRSMPSNVRIVEGASLTEGRIEVFDPVDTGVWGTVCRSSELNTRTGELLADQLGQYGFDRFGSDGEFPESLYVATVKNPHCNSNALNILNCFEQGGSCDVTHVGIKFTESSLGLCEGTFLEDSESQCSCHKTITKAHSNSCIGYGTVCSPSIISHTGDIDVYLYTPPNDDPVETNGETTTGDVTSSASSTSQGETTTEETTFVESTVGETTLGEVTTKVTTFSDTTIGETTSPETTPRETTAEETTFAESTVEETTIGEVTTEVTTFSETTICETTPPETTPGETTAEETTFAESNVEETTIGEVTTEATTSPEAMLGETTLAEVTVRETTVGEATAAETTTGEIVAADTALGEATATEPTSVNTVTAWNTETAPFTEGTVLPGTDVTVLFSEAQTPEFPSVGYGSSVTVLPLDTDYGFDGDLQRATTKHCGSLACPKNLQYSDRAEPVDLRGASISASTSKANYNPEKAFLQQLIADPLDLDYLLDNILLDYEDFNGWRAEDDDVHQPYIRVDFDRTVTVQGVIILGERDSSARVTSLKVAYTDTRETTWKYYHEDTSTESVVFGLDYTPGYAMLMFNQWHEARGLILLPQTWKGEIWMRIFVLGATYEGGTIPLGMQSGEIASAQIWASSYLDKAHAPWEGRFNGPSAWCAAPDESKPWIKIDLLTHAHIDKFVVHGLVNTSVDYPAASGSYPTELKFKASVVDDFYSYVDVELQGNSANSAEDVQEYITTWDPVARYVRIKILSSSTAFNCLRVEIYGYMSFEKWPDFNSTHLDDHIEYATDEDIHLECSCFTDPPIEPYKEDYFFFLSGTEISNTFCPGHTRQLDASAATPSSAWPETGSGLSPVTESATTGFIFTDIFSVDMSSPAAHGLTSSSSSSWLCPDVPPDMVFTSTVIYREALTIRGGHVKLNYFLRGDDRTSWTLYMRVWTESTSGSWTHEDEVIAEVHGSPDGAGSPGEWREFHLERQFSEKYQLIAVFTIVADGQSMLAFEADSFHLVSDSFIGAKESNLGMQNLNILDRQISASSERDPNTSARTVRLFDGTGWCPGGNDVDPWIQVDMEREVVLNGIMIQGKKYMSDWVTKYYIRVSNDGDTWLYYDNLDYPTIFEGSWSSNMVVMQTLPNPMYCQLIRIYPVANNTSPCLRFELTSFKSGSGGSTASPTPQGIPTTPTDVTTSNSITKATSTNTEATTALVVERITPPGQVQNSTTAHSTSTTGPTVPTDGPTKNAKVTLAPSSTVQPSGTGGNPSGSPSPATTTGSEEKVQSEIVKAKGVGEVFNAVTDPNITVTFETASTALNVVDNLTHQSSGRLNKEDIDNIKGTLSAVSSQAASTKETAQTFLDIVETILVLNDTLTDPEGVSSENSTSVKKHASSIMELLESFASDAAKNLLSPAQKKVVIQNDELVLQLTKISPEDTANITEPVIVSVNSSMNELHFPPSVFRGRNVTISAVVFNNLHLTSSSQLGGLHGNDTPTSVGSKIMSIQVEATDGSEVTFSADDPIELVLELNEDANTTNSQSLCVFWEFLEDEESGGVWSTVGCHRNQTNGSQITCRCDHLTNFAILLQVNPNPVVLSLAHRVTLDMLTYIGLALSIAALVCSLTTFVLLKLMKSQRTIIHTNLCIALLSAQLLYLIGIERTASSELCTTIAVLLHYLFTSTFSWMLMEGIYILMQARAAYGKGGKTWMYMLAGWGSPLVIIAVSLGLRLDGYGTDDYCWLSVENGFMWAFASPVLAVLAINTAVLIMVIRVFMALKANLDKTEAERLRAGVRAVLLLQPLLGFTWVFGLLAAYDSSLFFAYMFVIFNSLQGVFIFIVNCLMNEEVKKAFRAKYHRYGGHGRQRRSTQTTQMSTTETSVALKTTRAFMDRTQTRTTSKSSQRSSVVEGLAIKMRSTKVQPLSDDKSSTKL